MQILKHMIEQPFVLATGLAALIHSTWSLGTLFSGTEPSFGTLHWFGWIIPALLIAFALDVGQIATSADIRANGLTLSRGVTFGVFSLATWYLQWLYIAHHMPALELAPGISEMHRGAALFLRDMAMWFIPALLPLSTMLYTISGHHDPEQVEPVEPVTVEPVEQPQEQPFLDILELNPPTYNHLLAVPILERSFKEITTEDKHLATCTFCSWTGEYETAVGAQRAARAHERACAQKVESNGHFE